MEGDESMCCPNCQTSLVIVHHELCRLFWHFIHAIAYHLDQYMPSAPSTKELQGQFVQMS